MTSTHIALCLSTLTMTVAIIALLIFNAAWAVHLILVCVGFNAGLAVATLFADRAAEGAQHRP